MKVAQADRKPVRQPRAVRAAAPAGPSPEFEIKFLVPDAARDALRHALEALHCRAEPFEAHYHDTADGRIGRAGGALRLRREGKRWMQTLKLAGAGPFERAEHNVELRTPARGAAPRLDIGRHAGTPGFPELQDALAAGPRQPLVERFRTEVLRRAATVMHRGSQVEIAFDEGRILAGEREQPVCEIEFELKSGEPAAAAALAQDWAQAYGLWLSAESKGARGQRLAEGGEVAAVKATPPLIDAGMAGEAMLRAVLRSCLAQIVPNAGVVAAGSGDPEVIHQLRVGLRRLRTALRELGDLGEALDPHWEAPMAQVFRQLGAFRDRQTVLDALRPELLEAGAAGVDWMASFGETGDPVAAVRGPAFQSALLAVIGFGLQRDAPPAADAQPALRRRLRKRLQALHRRVAVDGARFEQLNEAAQHGVRKRLKRLRYLSEFVEPLFGQRPVGRYLDSLRPAQDALGLHNDRVVARELAAEAARQGDADARFAVRWLEKKQKQSAKASRRALAKVEQARRFWTRGAAP